MYSQGDIKARLAVTSSGQLYMASTEYCSKDNPTIELPEGLKSGFSGNISLTYVENTDLGHEIYIEATGKKIFPENIVNVTFCCHKSFLYILNLV